MTHPSRGRLIRLLAGLLLAASLVGCGAGASSGSDTSGPGDTATLTVSAAASLTEVFDRLAREFERENPGVTVRVNYGGSSSLAQQIVHGAPVDVFASANTTTMDTVAGAGLITGEPVIFATNKLQIAVPPGNPMGVRDFADLVKPDLKVVVCARQVPCGSATEKVEAATGVRLTPVSEETDVRSVLSKVATGDADAGVVYLTDVRSAAGKVDGVEFPAADQAINSYPIAQVADASQPELAGKFIAFVRSPRGEQALRDAGFGTP